MADDTPQDRLDNDGTTKPRLPLARAMGEVSRRQILTGGLIGAGAAAVGGAAALLNGRDLRYYLPPNVGSLGSVAEALSFGSSRIILSRDSLVPEYPASAVTVLDNWQKNAPADPELIAHLATKFEHWRLRVTGNVLRPAAFSLADLGQLPKKTQVVARHCINGYTSIAPYTGVPLRDLLAIVGLGPDVRYIGFESYYDMHWDSIDLFDAFHPQTVLSFEEFPGQRVSWTRGAPLRLSAPLHFGYKWIKGIKRIIALENLEDFGDGTGMGSAYASKGRTWSAVAG